MADAYEEVVGGALKLKGVADGGVKKWVACIAFVYLSIMARRPGMVVRERVPPERQWQMCKHQMA